MKGKRTTGKRLQILAAIEGFSRHPRADTAPDQQVNTIGQTLLKKWAAVFCPTDLSLSLVGPSLADDVTENLTDILARCQNAVMC